MIEGELAKGAIDRLVASVDTFRRTLAKAISSEDFWPIFLLIAAGIFLIDVFIRRVTVHFYWVLPALAYAYNRVLRPAAGGRSATSGWRGCAIARRPFPARSTSGGPPPGSSR